MKVEGFVPQLKVMLDRKKITASELAKRTNQSRANLNNKMNRANFTEAQMREVADAIGCDLELELIDRADKTK